MGVFEQWATTAEEGAGTANKFIKSDEFTEAGMRLTFLGVEKIKSPNPKYGVNEADYLFKQGILAKGETFKYTFKDGEVERVFESKSTPFFIGFKNVDPTPPVDVIIKRFGVETNTRYTVEYAPLKPE